MVVLRNQEAFLLLKRAKQPNQNKYVPVGGKLEPFENPRSAAIRETFEETGIRVDNLKYCGFLVESSPTAYNWQCNIYLSDIKKLPPPPCDEGILEWIDFKQIPDLPAPPTDWWIYRYIMEERPFAFDAIYNKDLELLEMVEEIEGKTVFKNH